MNPTATLRKVWPALALLAAMAAIMLFTQTARDASASPLDGGFVDHPTLVPETPERLYPRILTTPTYVLGNRTYNRETLAIDMVGDYIVSGGNFLNVELQNGTVISQGNLAIFNSITKDIVCPGLVTNGDVRAIVRGDEPDTVIIGGKFTNATGTNGQFFRPRIAKLRIDTCEVDENWIIDGMDKRVTELALSGDRLFIGGDFTTIEGQAIGNLAEVDHATAALNSAMDFAFVGGNAGRKIVGLEANPAGTRLGVIHRATEIDGNSMRATAVINIANPAAPSLTAHRTSTSAKAYTNYFDIMDGAIDPDFTYFVTVQGTATVSDYVSRINVTEAPGQFVWEHFMRDSTFSVAVSNNAIYVGGHFCMIDGGPGAALMAPNVLNTCSGTFFENGNCNQCNGFPGVWRSQLAALNPADGVPLAWNPGNDALVGSRAMTVVNRGLLVGYDGEYTHGAPTYLRVGTTAFFDFGITPDPRDNMTCTATEDPAGGLVNIVWSSVAGVTSWDVQRDGAVIQTTAGTSATDTPGVGTFTYSLRSILNGVVKDTPCGAPITVGPVLPTCTATILAGDIVEIAWDPIAGVDDFSLRRNGQWIQTVMAPGDPSPSATDNPGPGTWDYSIRFWMGGVNDVVCTPTITIAGANPTCTAALNPDGTVTLSWTDIPGITDHYIRVNDAWIQTVGDVTTTTVTPAGAGTWAYEVRYWQGGANDIDCNPWIVVGTPMLSCTATPFAGGVQVDWTAVPGEVEYYVRKNNAWLATVNGALTYVDAAGTAGDSYVVRYFEGGPQDIVCN